MLLSSSVPVINVKVHLEPSICLMFICSPVPLDGHWLQHLHGLKHSDCEQGKCENYLEQADTHSKCCSWLGLGRKEWSGWNAAADTSDSDYYVSP